jgi:hypothetical protein
MLIHSPSAAPDLPISRTLRIRGTRQNASTDHLPQNVEPSRRGDSARPAPMSPASDGARRSERPITRRASSGSVGLVRTDP